MRNYLFLYKENNTDDRDSVNYIDIERLGKLELGHYFPRINLSGACFSKGLKYEEIDFDNIQTVLTQEDFKKLARYSEKISDLGYGIKEGDERYFKGIELYKEIEGILNKLTSVENEELFNKVVEQEKEIIKEQYDLENEEVETIFEEYELSYQDRGIVGHIFNDLEEASKEEADGMGYVNEDNERYFDYSAFGEDLLMSENVIELSSGKIAMMNY